MKALFTLFILIYSYSSYAGNYASILFLIDRGKYKEALKEINITTIADPQLLFLKAKAFYELGARYSAIGILDTIEQHYKQSSKYSWERHYFLKANIFYEISDLGSMWNCSFQYKRIIDEIPNNQLYYSIYNALLAKYYAHKTESDSASYYARQSLKIFRENKQHQNLIEPYFIYSAYAMVCRNSYLDDRVKWPTFLYYDSALFYFRKQYPYNNYNLAKIYDGLATAYLDHTLNYAPSPNNDTNFTTYCFRKSQIYYDKAIDMISGIAGPCHPELARCYLLKALEYYYRKDYKSAQLYSIKANNCLSFNGQIFPFHALYQRQVYFIWKSWIEEKIYGSQTVESLRYQIKELEEAGVNSDLFINDLKFNNADFFYDNYNLRPFGSISFRYTQLYSLTGNQKYLQLAFHNSEKQKYYSIIENSPDYKDGGKEEKLRKLLNIVRIDIEKSILFNNSVALPTIRKNKDEILETIATLHNFSIPSLLDLQQTLKRQQAYLYYNYAQEQYIGSFSSFVITKNSISVLMDTIDRYGYFFNPQFTSERLSSPLMFRKFSFDIYQKYFKKSIAKLSDSIKQLIIFPLSITSKIPISALLTDTVGSDFSQFSYLNKKYITSYALSASILLRQLSNSTNKISMLGVTPFIEKGSINELPFNNTLLNKLLNNYSGKLLAGKEATREEILHSLEEFNCIHFAAHSVANKDFWQLSGIYLNNDKIGLADIYNLNLASNNLTVLSSCESGDGVLQTNEGVINFARAFSSCGSRAQILTFFKVDDQATSEILEGFYKYLDEGLDKASALHKAQLDYFDNASIERKSPMYWSGLYLTGNTNNIQIEKRHFPVTILYVIAGMVFLFFSLFFFFRKRF